MKSPRAAPAALDVYLLPAVVGGGLGDIEEVLAAGRLLSRDGHAIRLYRAPGRPLPASVEGPWAWPPHRRVSSLDARAPRALTLSAWWGVSAAPPRDEPLGRAGPWAPEAVAVERAYGAGRVLHVSLEEFARTLTSRQQTFERWREGGLPAREIRRSLAQPEAREEIRAFRLAYDRFRAFERPDVLHLVTGFRYSRAYAREFPEAVQTGPLWPGRFRRSRSSRPRNPRAPRTWVWYASPSTSDRLAARLARGARTARVPLRILVRAPRPFALPESHGTLRWESAAALDARRWVRRFAAADLRIVTGSRTLLEALELGGPFLYFNGVLGAGARTRVHRPEKLRELLALGRLRSVPAAWRRDLADFARLRRVEAIVRAALHGPDRTVRYPRRLAPFGFRPPFDDAGVLLRSVASAHARGREDAETLVARVRARKAP